MLARIAILVLTLCLPLMAAANVPAWCTKLPRAEFKQFEKVAIVSDWFEVYKIKPDIYAIYEPRQLKQVISYLIVGNKRALLFDTGMGIGNIKAVVNQLTKLPVVVVNSHNHYDHVGDNWQFSEVYAMRTAYKENKVIINPNEICGKLPAGFDPKNYQTKPYQITRYLHDRDKIDLGGTTLHVIAAKGHTPDSLALYDNQRGILFTGDTFYLGSKLAGITKAKTLLFSHKAPTAMPWYLKQSKDALSKVLLAIILQDPLNRRLG